MTHENKQQDPSKTAPVSSETTNSPNYAKRRFIALGLGSAVIAIVLGGGAFVSNHTDEFPGHESQLVTIDNIDSDGNKLDNHTAAVEDITNAALEQADELGIENQDARENIVESVVDEVDAAIEDNHGSLIGKTVEVKIVKDFFDEPKVAIVQQK